MTDPDVCPTEIELWIRVFHEVYG